MFLVLRFGKGEGNAHAFAGFDALHRAVHFDGLIRGYSGGKTRAHPESIG